MPRDAQAYLLDIIDACAAVEATLQDVDLQRYLTSRSVRSSVEREFITIGEAVGNLARLAPELAARITHARLIVGFRNRLVHDYAAIDDEAVFRIAQHDVAALRADCENLLAPSEGGSGAD